MKITVKANFMVAISVAMCVVAILVAAKFPLPQSANALLVGLASGLGFAAGYVGGFGMAINTLNRQGKLK